MKKIITLFLMVVISMTSVSVFADEYYMGDNVVGLFINDEWIVAEQPPVIENDRTIAPIREVSENLGFNVGWEDTEKKITITKGGTEIIMYIDNTIITKNGEEIICDVAPIILNKKTMVPVRVVAELLECDVKWNDDSHTVFVDSPKAYNHYCGLDYTVPNYGEEYTSIQGYLGKFVAEADGIISFMSLEKYYIIIDGRCKITVNDGYGNMTTYTNVKRIDVDFNTDEDVSALIGKRVTLSGKMMGASARVNIDPYRFVADSIKGEEVVFESFNSDEFIAVLNTPHSITGEAVEWAKLVDINKDGKNEMIVLEEAKSMSIVNLCVYSNTEYGTDKEIIEVGNYSHSGYFKDGSVDLFANEDHIVVRNNVNMATSDSEGNEPAKGTSYTRLSVNSDGALKRENAYYYIKGGELYSKDYDEEEEKQGNESEINQIVLQNYIGSPATLFEIVPDYKTGTADIDVNEEFFDTRDEVINQLKK